MGTIANKLNKIKNTKDKIKTITNLSTVNTITSETIFKNYPKQILKEYIKIINNGTNELYTNFPKVEDEGTKLELGTERGPLKITLEGNTSQDGTPTPDIPIPIKVVTGEQNITIQSKNLCDLSQGYRRGYINANGGAFKAENVSYVLKQYIEVIGGNTYTYSTNQPINNMAVYSYNENKEFIKRERLIYSKKVCTVTVDSNAKYILLGGNYNNYNAITQAILNGLDIQLENGSTATTYAPYQLQTYSLSLGNIELARINNYKDYIFKNEVGSPYYNADLELNEWYLHKVIGKTTLTENSWGGVRNVTIGGTSRPIFYSRNDNFKSYNSMVSMMCNYFQVKKTYGTSPTANNQFYCNYERTNNLEFAKFDLTTAAEWKEWLSTHNVILVGRLANPTNTQITDTTLISQLENINNNAKSYSGTTIIECSSSTDDNETIQISAIALQNIN